MYHFPCMDLAARGVKNVATVFLESTSAGAPSWLESGLLRPDGKKRLRCGVHESMNEYALQPVWEVT